MFYLLVRNITAYVFGLQILHNFFSDHDKCPGTSNTSMMSLPETVKLDAEDDLRDFGMHWYFTTAYTLKQDLWVKLYCMS